MGNYYCKVCKVQLQGEGNMCLRCYEEKHPICSVCKKRINAGEQTLCGVHKFPCYGKKYGRCHKCDNTLPRNSTRSVCENCYEHDHPPLPKLVLRKGDAEIALYSTDGSTKECLKLLGYAIGRGLSDEGNEKRYLE